MSKAGKRLIAAMQEALAIARGEQAAASIWVRGHRYVPTQPITPSSRFRHVDGTTPEANPEAPRSEASGTNSNEASFSSDMESRLW